jgi:hypothetical protein
MIKIEHLQTFNWESAIRGMRNPMMSHGKSDSYYAGKSYILGNNDAELLLKLCRAGSEHRKTIRSIFISCDILAPDLWFKEFSTYKIGTVENSSSTMHKLTSNLLTKDDFSIDEWGQYHDHFLAKINSLILDYQLTKKASEEKAKSIFRSIIQILPMSYNYLRTVSMNYEVLANMYHQRSHHKLTEWREFCLFMKENLPYFEIIENCKK